VGKRGRNLLIGATLGLVLVGSIGAFAWMKAGEAPAPMLHPRMVLEAAPQVDLGALDNAAAALPVPAETLRQARLECAISHDAAKCAYRDDVEKMAGKNGVD
jgi:hypothetical protein